MKGDCHMTKKRGEENEEEVFTYEDAKSEEEALTFYRRVRDEIRTFIERFPDEIRIE